MEMIWYTNKNNTQSLFTGVLYNIYVSPPGFCWDIICNDDPIVDDKESKIYNIDERILSFINYVKTQANSLKTNNVAVTMGDDFRYSVSFKVSICISN